MEREMTMVDRVARTIYEKLNAQGLASLSDFGDDLTDVVFVEGRVDLLEIARAAIEEMREPTEAMVEASAAIYGDNYLYRYEYSKDQWRAMIDAALKGEKS
jgi:coenzyme F420-reducing hydrogenase gamma subunit